MEKIQFLRICQDFSEKEMCIKFLLPAIEAQGNILLLKLINSELQNFLLGQSVNVLLLLEFISKYILELSKNIISYQEALKTLPATKAKKQQALHISEDEEEAFTTLFFLEKEYKGGPNSPHGKVYKEFKGLKSIPDGKDNEFKRFRKKYQKWKEKRLHPGKGILNQISFKSLTIEATHDILIYIFSQMETLLNSNTSEIQKILHTKNNR